MRFRNLPMSSGQKREDLIQSIKLQELQIDPKIQLIKNCSKYGNYAIYHRIPSNKLTLEYSNTNHQFQLEESPQQKKTKNSEIGSEIKSESNQKQSQIQNRNRLGQTS